MRTNIEIDDDLMRDAMIVMEARTKREAVHKGLAFAIQIKRQAAMRDLRGIGWEGDLEAMRLD